MQKIREDCFEISEKTGNFDWPCKWEPWIGSLASRKASCKKKSPKNFNLFLMRMRCLFLCKTGGCPMFNIPGFTFPVKEYMLEDVMQLIE